MNESKLPPSRANIYVQLGAQLYSNSAPHASSGDYIVGQLHTGRTWLTREQIAARCRRERREAGLPVYEAPSLNSRETRPAQRKSLLQQAASVASGLWTATESVFNAVMPRFPGASASALGKKETGSGPDVLAKSAVPTPSSVNKFAELAESLGLHAGFSHWFSRPDPSGPARSASWTVTPSFDPATLSLDEVLVLLESGQPGDQRQAEQMKAMLSFLLQNGMQTFTASPDVLERLPCGTGVNCVPVRSICDGKLLLDTVLAALPGEGNVAILPPDAIESLASMISPGYANATDDFVWVTSSPVRTLAPQYRLNCTAQPSAGQISPPPSFSCAENERRTTLYGFAFGAGGALLGVALGATIFLCGGAANAKSSVTQLLPLQLGNDNTKDKMDYSMENEKNEKSYKKGETEDDMDHGMKNMRSMKNEKEDDAEGSRLEEITGSDDD